MIEIIEDNAPRYFGVVYDAPLGRVAEVVCAGYEVAFAVVTTWPTEEARAARVEVAYDWSFELGLAEGLGDQAATEFAEAAVIQTRRPGRVATYRPTKEAAEHEAQTLRRTYGNRYGQEILVVPCVPVEQVAPGVWRPIDGGARFESENRPLTKHPGFPPEPKDFAAPPT